MRESGQDSKRNAGTLIKEEKNEEMEGLVERKEIFNVIFEHFQGVVTNFEIFRMREKQVPVDVMEMKGESRGKHSSPSGEQHPDVSPLCLFQRASSRLPGSPTAASLLFSTESLQESASPFTMSKITERSTS